MSRFLTATVLAGLSAAFLSACAIIMPEQAMTVTTTEPGAQVYMALHGNRSVGVASSEFTGQIPLGQDNTEFVYVGETPLEHTFHTARHTPGLVVAGEVSSSQSTYFSQATIRVVYADGSREQQRVQLNNQHIEVQFDGRAAIGPQSN